MSTKTHTTSNHDEINTWAERYGGIPEIIDDREASGDVPGIRIDFPGKKDDKFISRSKYHKTSWEEFFRLFDDQELEFTYSEELDTNDPGSSYKFSKKIPPNEEDEFDEVL